MEIERHHIVDEAQARHPGVRSCYAWPFDPHRVAQLFAEEIKNSTRTQWSERAAQ